MAGALLAVIGVCSVAIDECGNVVIPDDMTEEEFVVIIDGVVLISVLISEAFIDSSNAVFVLIKELAELINCCCCCCWWASTAGGNCTVGKDGTGKLVPLPIELLATEFIVEIMDADEDRFDDAICPLFEMAANEGGCDDMRAGEGDEDIALI